MEKRRLKKCKSKEEKKNMYLDRDGLEDVETISCC